jgi:hypothetical protein
VFRRDPVADIPIWKYVVGGAATLLAIVWPKIQAWWAARQFSKVVPAHPAGAAGSDDTPDPIIAEWAKQVIAAAPENYPHFHLMCILEGKTLMQVVKLDRDSRPKSPATTTTTA